MSRFTDALCAIWNGKDPCDFREVAAIKPDEVLAEERFDAVAGRMIRHLGSAITCEMKDKSEPPDCDGAVVEFYGRPRFGGLLCVFVEFKRGRDGIFDVSMSAEHCENGDETSYSLPDARSLFSGATNPFGNGTQDRAALESWLMFETMKCVKSIRDFKHRT